MRRRAVSRRSRVRLRTAVATPQPPPSRLAKMAMAVLASLAITLSGTSPASASNFNGCFNDPQHEPCYANNSTQYMAYDLSPGWRSATEATRTQSYDTTDLTTALTVHEASDVWYTVDPLLEKAYGYYTCLAYKGNGMCSHGHISYSGPLGPSLTGPQLQSVACHETDHTLGLLHPNPDDASIYQCMVVGGFPPYMGQHNVAHINARY